MSDLIPPSQQGIVTRMSGRYNEVDQMMPGGGVAGGEYLLRGAGETRVLVAFPIWFTARPLFTYGFAMDTDFRVEDGNFPVGLAVVNQWHIERKTGGTTGYFTGAELAVRITGRGDQQIWLNWKMEGPALRNPVQPTVGGGGVNT